MQVWFDGKFISRQRARVPIETHALHYGTAAFEGIRFYDTNEGAAVFRLRDHIKRLLYSARWLGMPLRWSLRTLERAVIQTVRKSKLRSGYIRPIIFYGAGGLGLATDKNEVHCAIFVLPWGKYLPKQSVSLKIVSVRRFSARAFNPRAKISGVYVNSVVARQEAAESGFDEALLLDQDGYIAEGSGENIFIVKNGRLYTPLPGSILPGITRASVITLARGMKIPVEEKRLTPQECYHADECFLTGTAAEITPVSRINNHRIGALVRTVKESVTERLRWKFFDAVAGALPRYRRWLTFI